MDSNLLFGPLGTLAATIIAVGAFVSGRVITRGQYQEMMRYRDETNRNLRIDRDYWRQLALSGTSLAAKATELAAARQDSAMRSPAEAPPP